MLVALLGVCQGAVAAPPATITADGIFRIMIVADVQDDQLIDMRYLDSMRILLRLEQPDLVVFLGDQLHGNTEALYTADEHGFFEWLLPTFADSPLADGRNTLYNSSIYENVCDSIALLLSPVVDAGIPFAFVFGNHDEEIDAVSREEQLKIYQSFPGCLAYEAVADVDGVSNYNLIVQNEAGEAALNLVFIDTNGLYSCEGSIFDPVYPSQVEWTAQMLARVESEYGSKVPAVVFQHSIVPEIYSLLKRTSWFNKDAKQGYDRPSTVYLLPDSSIFESGEMREMPCCPTINYGQFSGWKQDGSVFAGVFGHDHINNFVTEVQGIKLIACPGAGYQCYGDDDMRGVRMLEFKLDNPQDFFTYMLLFRDCAIYQQAAAVKNNALDRSVSMNHADE